MIWAGMLSPARRGVWRPDGQRRRCRSWPQRRAHGAAGGGIWFVIAYFFNQAIIDFATGARPVSRTDEPQAYNLLENLCISRGLTMPTLRVIETDGMNAFASGLHQAIYRHGHARALDSAGRPGARGGARS